MIQFKLHDTMIQIRIKLFVKINSINNIINSIFKIFMVINVEEWILIQNFH